MHLFKTLSILFLSNSTSGPESHFPTPTSLLFFENTTPVQTGNNRCNPHSAMFLHNDIYENHADSCSAEDDKCLWTQVWFFTKFWLYGSDKKRRPSLVPWENLIAASDWRRQSNRCALCKKSMKARKHPQPGNLKTASHLLTTAPCALTFQLHYARGPDKSRRARKLYLQRKLRRRGWNWTSAHDIHHNRVADMGVGRGVLSPPRV